MIKREKKANNCGINSRQRDAQKRFYCQRERGAIRAGKSKAFATGSRAAQKLLAHFSIA
jgi:hypothetical protein